MWYGIITVTCKYMFLSRHFLCVCSVFAAVSAVWILCSVWHQAWVVNYCASFNKWFLSLIFTDNVFRLLLKASGWKTFISFHQTNSQSQRFSNGCWRSAGNSDSWRAEIPDESHGCFISLFCINSVSAAFEVQMWVWTQDSIQVIQLKIDCRSASLQPS